MAHSSSDLVFEADYHIHSTFSDGASTLEQNVQAALERGLKRIALTEHGPRHLHAGVKRRRLPDYFEQVAQLRQRYGERIDIRTGMELNPLSQAGDTDLPSDGGDRLQVRGLAYHLSVMGKGIRNNYRLHVQRHLFPKKARDMMTTALIAAMERTKLSFLAHPGQHAPLDWARIGAACAQHNVALEISARPRHLCFSVEQARAMKAQGAVFVVDSDAHDAKEIGRFDRVREFIAAAGLGRQDIVNAQGFEGLKPFGL